MWCLLVVRSQTRTPARSAGRRGARGDHDDRPIGDPQETVRDPDQRHAQSPRSGRANHNLISIPHARNVIDRVGGSPADQLGHIMSDRKLAKPVSKQLIQGGPATALSVGQAATEIRCTKVFRRPRVGVDDEHLPVLSSAPRSLDYSRPSAARAVIADDHGSPSALRRVATVLDQRQADRRDRLAAHREPLATAERWTMSRRADAGESFDQLLKQPAPELPEPTCELRQRFIGCLDRAWIADLHKIGGRHSAGPRVCASRGAAAMSNSPATSADPGSRSPTPSVQTNA